MKKGRSPISLVLLLVLLAKNQCHEHKVVLTVVLNAVLFPVRAEGGSADTDFHLIAVIVVECLALEDVIGFRVAVMLMHADGASGRNCDLGEHVSLPVQLGWRENLCNRDLSFSACLVFCMDDLLLDKCHVKQPLSLVEIWEENA